MDTIRRVSISMIFSQALDYRSKKWENGNSWFSEQPLSMPIMSSENPEEVFVDNARRGNAGRV